MPSGSSVAFFYGFIFCVVCNFCLSASVGELSSIWPTAGGQYHYAFALSSEHWKMAMVSPQGDEPTPTLPGLTICEELLGWMDQYRRVADTDYH